MMNQCVEPVCLLDLQLSAGWQHRGVLLECVSGFL